MHEFTCYRDYVSEEPLSYWRSTSGFEVDFIIFFSSPFLAR